MPLRNLPQNQDGLILKRTLHLMLYIHYVYALVEIIFTIKIMNHYLSPCSSWGGVEVTGGWGRRRRKLLYDLKERRGYSHLKEEALDRTMWRARIGRGFGPVVRQTAKWMDECSVVSLSVNIVKCTYVCVPGVPNAGQYQHIMIGDEFFWKCGKVEIYVNESDRLREWRI
jgi:hypothetical protein